MFYAALSLSLLELSLSFSLHTVHCKNAPFCMLAHYLTTTTVEKSEYMYLYTYLFALHADDRQLHTSLERRTITVGYRTMSRRWCIGVDFVD